MAGNLILAGIVCLALANAVSAQVLEGTYNVTAVCTMLKTGTQVGSTLSCDYYYVCSASGPVKQFCSSGYAYNYQTQNCQPASQVQCYYGVANPCSGKIGANWVPNVNDCQSWVYCVGEQVSGGGSCIKGEIFDGKSQRCVYGSCSGSGPGTVNVGTGQINYCSVVPPNMYFGSTSNCKAWNYCSSQGALSTGECASTAFIVSTATCGYDSAPGACDRVVNAPVPTTCTTKGQVTPDPTVCGNYYICDGTLYQLYECPIGSYYDITRKNCVARQSASPVAGCNRCQYATTSFVNAVNYQTCSTYYYCSNGVNGGVSSCGEGSFFNEADQACAPVSGLLTYDAANGACAGATASTTTVSTSTGTTDTTTTTETTSTTTQTTTTTK